MQAVARPKLREVPLAAVLPPISGRCYVTMSVGQWDAILQAAYSFGWVLLELDDREQPIAAYQRQSPHAN